MPVCESALINDTSFERPHLVILGAGASRAALPNGDCNGNHLPVMNDLVEMVGLEPLLAKHGLSGINTNFESIYSKLCVEGAQTDLLAELEQRIRGYFEKLAVPFTPTLYDHLLLSLRKKDVIATFNWDPLLAQACIRNAHFASLPYVLFLHGNVAIGYCEEHKTSGPFPMGNCPICKNTFSSSNLLYPTGEKDYTSNPHIATQWRIFREAVQDAYLLTIFGYSGPPSDAVAIEAMRDAWGLNTVREHAQIEIIDIDEEECLLDKWRRIMYRPYRVGNDLYHYQVVNDFYLSLSARHPRRSCEAVWQQTQEINWLMGNTPLPSAVSFEELYEWFAPLQAAES